MSVRPPPINALTWLLLISLCVACKHSERQDPVLASPPSQEQSPSSPGLVEAAIAACTLITTEEVGAIQIATITNAKSSAGPSGNVVMSQCYYSSKEPNKSVSLAIIQPKLRSSSGSEARDYWNDTFGRFREDSRSKQETQEKNKRGENAEEEEKRIPPKKVDGIGEEAYWSGNQFGGALYVLKSNVFIRISVGGPDNEESKISKSKALAQKALQRLPNRGR